MLDSDNLKKKPKWNEFGKMVRQFRKRLGMRQTDLARLLSGYVNSVVSKLESGDYPHTSVDDIAHRLGVLFVRTGVIRSARQMRDWLELIFTVVTPQDVEEMIAAAREQPLDDIDPVVAGTRLEIIDSFASTLHDAFTIRVITVVPEESTSIIIAHELTEAVSVAPIAAVVAFGIAADTISEESTSIIIAHEPAEALSAAPIAAVAASGITADTISEESISTVTTYEPAEALSAAPLAMVVASDIAEDTVSEESTSTITTYESNAEVAAAPAAAENVLPDAAAEFPADFAVDQTYTPLLSVVELATNADSSSDAFKTPKPDVSNWTSAESVEELPITRAVSLISEHIDSVRSESVKTNTFGIPRPAVSNWTSAESVEEFPNPNAVPILSERIDSGQSESAEKEYISAKQQTMAASLLAIPFDGITIDFNERLVDKCKRIVRENLQAAYAGLVRIIIFRSYLSRGVWEVFVKSLVRFGDSDSSVNIFFEMIDTKFIFSPLFRDVDIREMSSIDHPYYESDRPYIYRSRLVEMVYSCAKHMPVYDQVKLYERLALRMVKDYAEMVRAVRALEKIGDFPAIRSLEHVIQQSQHDKVVRYAKDVLADLSTPAAADLAAQKLEVARKSADEWEQFTKCRTARKILREGKIIHHQTYTVLVDALQRVINDSNVDAAAQLVAADALNRRDVFRRIGIKIARTRLDERVV